MKILLVEDEPKVSAFVKEGLESNNYEVECAYDGNIGKRLALHNKYDLILLDVIIPHINGFELCRMIKKENPASSILMLTALGSTDDKVTAFNSGADDYLVKPFEFRELLARIQVLTRRNKSTSYQPIHLLKVGSLELDLDEKLARREGNDIALTAKEFALLEFFMSNKGKLLTRAKIAEKVWDINFDTGTNVVDVYVNLLRKKIDKDYSTKFIHTRVNMGYIFKEE